MVIGHIDIDIVKSGRTPVFDLKEEAKIVNYRRTVAKYGYRYTREDVVEIATDYCVCFGKTASNNPLQLTGFGD